MSRKTCWLAALLAAMPAPLEAQRDPATEIEQAKQLIERRDFDAAEQILTGHVGQPGRAAETHFLLGMIAIARSRPRRAIASFRSALVHEPDSIRLRLELARAFYLAHEYENAFRQFQRARAGNPPLRVVTTIDRYLAAIRLEKNWSYNLRFAFAPDSNLNSATSASSTDILGLPFELDGSARRKSGLGFAVEAGGEFAPRIGLRSRLRFGAQVQRREYKGSDFDDMSLVLHAGPRLIRSSWDLSLLGTGYRRWYGGSRYADGLGARAEVIHYPNGRTQLAAALFGQMVRYRRSPEEDGALFGLNLAGGRALSPSSTAIVRVGVIRQTAREAQFANWSASAAVGYLRDFRGGFSVYVEPSLIKARYDGEDLLFSRRRTDRIGQVTLSVLNRRIVASRFTPRLSITHTRRNSNIDLFDFKKNRLEIGLTSEF